MGPWTSQLSVGPSDHNVITVAAVRSSAATLTGELAGKPMEMMLDSGSAVSLVLKEEVDTEVARQIDKHHNTSSQASNCIWGAITGSWACSSFCENLPVKCYSSVFGC